MLSGCYSADAIGQEITEGTDTHHIANATVSDPTIKYT